MIRRLLVPLDGSELAEEALVTAGELAEGLNATLVLARVVPPPTPGRFYAPHLLEEIEEAGCKEAEEYLQNVAKRLNRDRLSVETHVLSGDVVHTLLHFARREHCDLIVMSSHGMGGHGWEVFGSVAQKLLHAAPCPVLTVRAGTKQILDQEEEAEEAATDRTLLRELARGA